MGDVEINSSVSPVRAIHGLSETQAAAVIAGLRDLPKSCSIDQHQSCDGHLSLLLSSNEDTTFVVDRSVAGFQISQMQGEQLYSGQNRYSSVDEVVEALKAMMDPNITGSYRRTA